MFVLNGRFKRLLYLLSFCYRWKSIRYLLIITMVICVALGISFTEAGYRPSFIRYETLKNIVKNDGHVSKAQKKIKMDEAHYEKIRENLITESKVKHYNGADHAVYLNFSESNHNKNNKYMASQTMENVTSRNFHTPRIALTLTNKNDNTRLMVNAAEFTGNRSNLTGNQLESYQLTRNGKLINRMSLNSKGKLDKFHKTQYIKQINIETASLVHRKNNHTIVKHYPETEKEEYAVSERWQVDSDKKIERNETVSLPRCSPAENIIFSKTHKTGSSTVINVMQRYAHKHNLKLALPKGTNLLGWPHPFRNKYVFEHTPGKKYNILCNHARFHKPNMLNIIKDKEKTKFITILRDPLYQFESTAVYLHFASVFKMNRKKNILDEFFKKSKEEIYRRTTKRNSNAVYLVKNPNAFDLGFPSWKENDAAIEFFLKRIKRDYHLVMISDYMAESLVLLKNELCWNLKDILYFTMNKRPDRFRHEILNITEARANIKKWNKLDYALFEHYNFTFWKKVREGGEAFRKDVKRLKAMNERLRKNCLDTGRHYDKSQPWFPILGFKLKNGYKKLKYRKLCEDMIRSEIDYTNFLKLKTTVHNWTIPTSPPRLKRRLDKNLTVTRIPASRKTIYQPNYI